MERDLSGRLVEWIPGGRFYLTGQPAVEGLYAKFSATDALGLLDGSYYKGIWDGKPHSLWDLATAVLEDANLPRRREDELPWTLWEGLKQVTTTAPLPVKQHRECLQLIAHAACCLLYADREGVIRIQPDESARPRCASVFQLFWKMQPQGERLPAFCGGNALPRCIPRPIRKANCTRVPIRWMGDLLCT